MEGQTEMDSLVEEMMEHVCDELCRHPRQAEGHMELEGICATCSMGEYVRGILGMYNPQN